MGLRHSSTCPYHGQSLLCVKKWFEAQISGILPDVSSYISHFVCLYNFNYTGRPLRGPGIIGINYSTYPPRYIKHRPRCCKTKEITQKKTNTKLQ